MSQLERLRSAYRLFKTDSRRDTYMAVGLALIATAPFLLSIRSRLNERDE